MAEAGALILVCRSTELDDFSWFKTRLHRELITKYKDRVTVMDVHSSEQLKDCLLSCPAPHDVSEIHLFAEFQNDTLFVSRVAGEFIAADNLGAAPAVSTLSIAGYLANTTCKIWFWSNADQPGFPILKDFARYFGHRFFFLPIGQLKRQAAKAKVHPLRQRQRQAPKRESVSRREQQEIKQSPLLANSSLRNVVLWLAFMGFMYSFFDDGLNYSSDSFDEVITHSDSPYEIETMTSGLRDTGGELAKHSWVYDRKKWDYAWFVADEWLRSADFELQDAAKIAAGSNYQYWGAVYNQLLEKNQYRLGTVANSLQREAARRNYDRYELASLTLAFVQHIPYKIPGNQLELMTPPTTLSKRYGDCDTKSLLYVAIMQQLGFDVSLYISNRYRHAMAGVNVNAMGTYKMHQGNRYYFVETTAVGHRIGQLSTGNGQVGSWQIIPLTNSARNRNLKT